MYCAASSRRDFLKGASTLAGGAWLGATLPAITSAAAQAASAVKRNAAFNTLSASEARTLAAIAAQIIPTDDTPGATEAGVIYFLDAAFGDFMSGSLTVVRRELPAFDKGANKAFETSGGFAALTDAQKVAYLTQQEQSPLFGLLQFLTTLGMFAMPTYGGNRDHVGWELIGFKHQHVWLPPFGFYDAEALRSEQAIDSV